MSAPVRTPPGSLLAGGEGSGRVQAGRKLLWNAQMPLHLIKLCVGVAEIEELRNWQTRRLAREGEVYHVTRMVPRRKGELLEGGSLYWVIRGQVQVRQRLTDIVAFTDAEGVRRCRLMLDPELVPVRPQPRRAFQGWRYLEPADAPPDLDRADEIDDMPVKMRAELAELGLL